jgi:Leucine-rich repeat (LRR) protein
LPDDQTGLQKINLGANPIASVPDGLRNARGLRFLGLARTHVTSLPRWLRDIECLRQLDISYIEHQLPANDLEELAERGVELIRKPGY